MKKFVLLITSILFLPMIGMNKQVIPITMDDNKNGATYTQNTELTPDNCCTPNGYGAAPCVSYAFASALTIGSIPIDFITCPLVPCYRVAPCPSNDFCDTGDNLCYNRPPIPYCWLTAILWGWEESPSCKQIISCCLPSNETRRKIWSCNMQ